jgi:hypothetical protein
VPPTAHIPSVLKAGPFTLREARAAGLSPTALRGRSWIRLNYGLYCWSGLIPDPWQTLAALQRILPAQAIYAGCTAAWALGIHVDPFDPIEVVVPSRSGVRSRPGLIVRRSDVGAHDVVTVRGIRVTSALRALCDLCPRLKGVEALALIDAALRLKLTDRMALVQAQSVCVRLLGPLAEPAESPMETRLRWISRTPVCQGRRCRGLFTIRRGVLSGAQTSTTTAPASLLSSTEATIATVSQRTTGDRTC